MFDILPIIQNMPQGRKVYCTIFGDVEVRVKRTREEYPILVWDECDALTRFGLWYSDKPNGECVLFPSKSCRDWNKWAAVLVKDGDLVKLDDGRVVRFDSRTHDYDDIVRFASEEEASEQEIKKTSSLTPDPNYGKRKEKRIERTNTKSRGQGLQENDQHV